MPKNRKPKSAVREWVESILIAFVLAVLIRSYILQPFKIPSGSMIPTLIVGDHLFVDKWTYGPQILPPMFWDIGLAGSRPLLSVRWPKALLPLTRMRLPGFREPQTGDIIVFVYPMDPTKDFIKRLIAVGGETVEIKNGFVYINGKKDTDPRLTKTYYFNRGDYGAEGEVVHVPKGYVYVMGDNSASSYDSRYWGFVPVTNIIGKADVIFWPLNRIGILR
ncbi:MAG: signal peptidase I [Candidatus Omnitrophica bacterium]|nr:signal peptidase I [Candidatus Omnitrophota bacterium]MDE2008638.1 signal peptidase I [Candidatus Omnitrophota bacterium]MDE2214979.1 signal peptidase I [Candidatus Omnitrophota bacterium]MDE2230918.1 signal peptidase I [Candidatus Omnitrophota bacterium]